jgi:uncharacterized oxidoreductase
MGTISADDLEQFVVTIVEAIGAPEDVAGTVTASLVRSELSGHGSHGVLRIAQYAEMIRDGAIAPAARPTVVESERATASIDGNRGFGYVTGREAVAEAVARAEEYGVAAVGIRNGAHLGRLGEWAERATDEGMCFMAFVNAGAGAQSVAPPGTADPRLATNPVAFGVPTYDALPFPIVYDGATSQVANGKIRKRAVGNELIPDGWTTGPDGEPVDEAAGFFDGPGVLLPLGGHATGYKGFGLAVIVELLAGLVGNGPVAGEMEPVWFNNAAMFVAVDPGRFIDRAAMEARIEALVEHVRSAGAAPALSLGPSASGDVYLLPGEPEYRSAQRKRDAGIELDDYVARALVDVAEEYSIAASVPATVDAIAGDQDGS